MSSKVPVRVVFDGSNNATGLAEYQSGEFVPLTHGGLGASLSIGSAGQVLKVNSGASALEFGNVEAILNIDGLTDGTSITVVDGDQLAISDGGTEKRITASQLKTYIGGYDGSISTLDIDGGTDIGAALADADLFIVDDGAGGTNRKMAASRIKTYIADVTLTTAAQTNITSVGTLSSLTVDNIVINGTNIGHTSDTDALAIDSSGNVTASQNLIVTGDLTVNGSTTTVSTTNTVITDQLIELNNGQTGTPSGDIGIVMERGDSNNAFMGFDESSDKFIVGTGSFTGSTTGDLTITTGTLVANIEGNVTGAVTGNADTATALATARTIAGQSFDGSANISIAPTDLTGVTSTAAELNLLDGVSGLVQADFTKLAAVDSTAAELNIVDGGTSATSTTVASGDRVVYNDAGTMVQVDVDDIDTYFSGTSKTLTNKTLTSPQINTQVDFLARAEARFQDASGGQYVALEAPATVSSSVTFTLPAADGTSGQVISTDGSGALSFTDVATSGFTNSTITDTPGSSANFDLAKGNNTGSAETPFETGGSDAFGVSVGFVFDAMEPIGSSTDNNTDLGSSESHVGA